MGRLLDVAFETCDMIERDMMERSLHELGKDLDVRRGAWPDRLDLWKEDYRNHVEGANAMRMTDLSNMLAGQTRKALDTIHDFPFKPSDRKSQELRNIALGAWCDWMAKYSRFMPAQFMDFLISAQGLVGDVGEEGGKFTLPLPDNERKWQEKNDQVMRNIREMQDKFSRPAAEARDDAKRLLGDFP